MKRGKDVILVSKPLRLEDARRFQYRTRDLFKGFIIPADKKSHKGPGRVYDMFYVARKGK